MDERLPEIPHCATRVCRHDVCTSAGSMMVLISWNEILVVSSWHGSVIFFMRRSPRPAREWSWLGSRDIDHKTRGARVRSREAIESKLSEFMTPVALKLPAQVDGRSRLHTRFSAGGPCRENAFVDTGIQEPTPFIMFPRMFPRKDSVAETAISARPSSLTIQLAHPKIYE